MESTSVYWRPVHKERELKVEPVEQCAKESLKRKVPELFRAIQWNYDYPRLTLRFHQSFNNSIRNVYYNHGTFLN